VRIKDKKCSLTSSQFTIFDIPNTFTPNGDGQNDKWKIQGLEFYNGSQIKVLDRWSSSIR
jgi:gliding motility-associated-like protein